MLNLKQRHPDVGDVWALDGEIAIRERRMDDAMRAVDAAVRLEPELADRHIQRARCYVIAGDTDEARISAKIALKYDIQRLDHMLILGGVLVRCDLHAEALTLYQRARDQAPANADVHRGLASVYRFMGRLDAAEDSSNQAIRIDPHDYEMIGLRSSLRTQTVEKNHIDELIRLEKSGLKHWRGDVHVSYALAKECEDVGRYEESFQWLKRGATTKRKHTQYDVHDDVRIFSSLKNAFSEKTIYEFAGKGDASADPIFVLGMPRTGSTLIERIITSHSMVQNCGELSTFSVEMMKLIEEHAGHVGERLKLAQRSVALPMARLGERYINSVAPIRDSSPRFVDKLPMNSLNIGLIHGALPNAKIVHVVRNPMDACYAMYKFLFKNGYPFSYSLDDLATYYAEYFHLMEHWRQVLPPKRIYDVVYEDVVADLPNQARQLIDHLALPWESICENFHANLQVSTTGSASQIREPVYKSSVGKWRHYAAELEPLKQALVRKGVPVS